MKKPEKFDDFVEALQTNEYRIKPALIEIEISVGTEEACKLLAYLFWLQCEATATERGARMIHENGFIKSKWIARPYKVDGKTVFKIFRYVQSENATVAGDMHKEFYETDPSISMQEALLVVVRLNREVRNENA